jgi:hypothetical protein
MSLFSMARGGKNNKESSDPSTPAAVEEQPRPGTSGTETLLVTNRRQARQQFEKAQRAEHSYRAKKRATAARRDFQDAKGHFKESGRHFRTGVKLAFGAVKSIPYICGQKHDERRKARAAAAKAKLEKKLAEQSRDDADAGQTTAEPKETQA